MTDIKNSVAKSSVAPDVLIRLAAFLSQIPGIGPKSATRFAMHLLQWPSELLQEFGQTIANIPKSVTRCSFCNVISQTDPCSICADMQRDMSHILIVGNSLDVYKIEDLGLYKGLYFVLDVEDNGVFNIDKQEDKQLVKKLTQRVCALTSKLRKPIEITFGIGMSMQTQALMLEIKQRLLEKCKKYPPKFYRLAIGLSAGAGIDFADAYTLKTAIINKQPVED